MNKLKVCVIGAGAAGLAAMRHLSSHLDLFDFVVYEKSNAFGGQWNYTEDFDARGEVHSSMYRNMRTNLPKEVMGYPGYPFSTDGRSFIHHTEVQDYLVKFTDHFDLKKYIKFNHEVRQVKPVTGGLLDKITWDVSVAEVGSDELITNQFDSVMVCNGRYSKPNIPSIPGMDTFQGDMIHSHHYRENTPYVNKTVVCLGRGPSGMDICLEIAAVAKKVVISHNKANLLSSLPSNTCQIPGITSMMENSITFNDGQTFKVDAVIFCTGYQFDFDFLHKDCKIKVEKNRVTPLFKHYINIEYPSLAVLGIPFTICPFPFFDTQVRFYLKYLSGEIQMPSKEEMFADEEKDFSERTKSGMPTRYAHLMSERQWLYHDDMYNLGSISGTAVPDVLRMLYNYVHETRVKDLMNYKKLSYLVTEDIFKLKN